MAERENCGYVAGIAHGRSIDDAACVSIYALYVCVIVSVSAGSSDPMSVFDHAGRRRLRAAPRRDTCYERSRIIPDTYCHILIVTTAV